MADVAEIFFNPTIEEEDDGDPETPDYDSTFWSSVVDHPHPHPHHHIVVEFEDEEDDDHSDFHLHHHRRQNSRQDYDLDEFPPVFSHDFFLSNQPFGSRISLEDDSESSFVEEEVAVGINLDDRRFQQRRVDGGGRIDANDPLELRGFGGGSDYLDVGVGEELGLGFGLDVEEQNCDDGVDSGGFRDDQVEGLDWSVDGFFVSRRSDRSDVTESGGGEEGSRIVGYESELEFDEEMGTCGGEEVSRIIGYESELEFEDERMTGAGEVGSRIVGYESELEFEEERVTVLGDSVDGVQASDWSGVDLGLTYSVEPLTIGYVRRELNEEFEWEEVDERADEREVLRSVADPNEEWSTREMAEYVGADLESEEQEEFGDVGWDLFLLLNNINREHDGDSYGEDDHEVFVHPPEYEVLFGQFANQGSVINGSPPAAKSVVEKLPSIVVAEDGPSKEDIVCAVCKDEISSGVAVKQLPCKHHYHGDCILPWLEIRNTCPVCRYELPTDDPDYEKRKVRRTGVGRSEEESQSSNESQSGGNTIEVLPEDLDQATLSTPL